jgi:hypothetical protein
LIRPGFQFRIDHPQVGIIPVALKAGAHFERWKFGAYRIQYFDGCSPVISGFAFPAAARFAIPEKSLPVCHKMWHGLDSSVLTNPA